MIGPHLCTECRKMLTMSGWCDPLVAGSGKHFLCLQRVSHLLSTWFHFLLTHYYMPDVLSIHNWNEEKRLIEVKHPMGDSLSQTDIIVCNVCVCVCAWVCALARIVLQYNCQTRLRENVRSNYITFSCFCKTYTRHKL